MSEHVIHPIAHIRTDFPSKFGIPRQSGLVPELEGTIVFEPEYRNPDALRGLETYTHIWLIWQFSEGFASREGQPDGSQPSWNPTVRPPKLDGNTRVGVFASRSPNRPNSLGLSVVRMTSIEPETPDGPLIHVAGVDLMDGTPIFDIKPYMPYTESIPEAGRGIGRFRDLKPLDVEIPEELAKKLPESKLEALRRILAIDPRPGYQDDPQRVYGFPFAGCEVRFRVEERRAVVLSIE
ncbi:MAG: tRNA (N6-threonylcarbamoyladenosine(37)-N6)-methyltransferase TrmO [Firmicutes bacterium]|nr:tRNA (N6-threonylcarbamoyladenosine(37)-N6)-methyltransferase TrmO [Bacillota bacterium]